jgi:hypothetical protein
MMWNQGVPLNVIACRSDGNYRPKWQRDAASFSDGMGITRIIILRFYFFIKEFPCYQPKQCVWNLTPRSLMGDWGD